MYNSTANIINAENNWWGNASGPYHTTLNPTGTGNNVSNNVDFIPWLTSDPLLVNNSPTLTNPNQYKSDSTTQIPENGITQESTVVFKATLNDQDNDQVKLQVELKEKNQPFDGANIIESSFVASGGEATITRYGLVPQSYKWRARVVDSRGGVSLWQEFGTAGDVDFIVELPLATKAANLAKEIVNHPEAYLWGGKGWDYNLSEFVASANILSGYTYWNPSLLGFNTGIGVDCSGLIAWAFNRANDAFMPAINNFVKYVNANGLYGNYQSDAVVEADLLPGDAMFFDWGSFNEIMQTWDGIKDGYIDHVAMHVGESGGYDVINARSPDFGIEIANKISLRGLSGFVNFRRIHQADVQMEITAGSPVNLTVTDPDGFVISSNSTIPSDEEYIREIPGILYYLEMEKSSDGNPIDRVYSPILKTGNYTIDVAPVAGSSPADTYHLEFKGESQTTILAENALLNQIPSGGYGIVVEKTGAISPFIPISIDIKPDSYPNTINLGSNGVIPVAIFGSATFAVVQIDPSTIKLANAGIKLKGNGQLVANYEDVNGDGFADIIIHIITEALELTEIDEKAELNGFLLDGRNIKGSDSIRVVP